MTESTDRGLLENTKTMLRSLLISVKGGLTLQQLNKDYIDENGEDVPFSALGYSNLVSFLKTIPDAVSY